MNAKEFLKQYKRSTEVITQLSQDIDDIVQTIGSHSVGDGTPRGSSIGDTTGELASRLADLKLEKESAIILAWSRREEVCSVIRSVPDVLQMRLLYARYIECLDWKNVADSVHVSETYARGRLHAAALHSVEHVLEGERKCD